jgi:hypothetical protein
MATKASRAKRVGRPRKGEEPKRAKKSDPEVFREQIILMKGSHEYFDFVTEVSRKTGVPKVEMFRLGFVLWCKQNGHGTPPEI